jgi:hypothetical protein
VKIAFVNSDKLPVSGEGDLSDEMLLILQKLAHRDFTIVLFSGKDISAKADDLPEDVKSAFELPPGCLN